MACELADDETAVALATILLAAEEDQREDRRLEEEQRRVAEEERRRQIAETLTLEIAPIEEQQSTGKFKASLLYAADEYSRTPLMVAAQAGNTRTVLFRVDTTLY